MDNSQHNNDLEKFMQRNLQGTPDAPDPETWDQIAAKQRRRNVWLKARFYALSAAPFAAGIAVVVAGFLLLRSGGAEQSGQQAQIAGNSADMQHTPNRSAEKSAPLPAPALAGETAGIDHFTHFKKWPSWNARNTVPAETMRFQAEKGVYYTSPVSGNTVAIPANALLLPDGSPAKGEVELLFREYRTLADYLASGMPMHYGDERGEFFFNSGGMFEVRVAQRGEALQMAPDASYEIGFTPTTKLSSTNLYYLDNETNEWSWVPGQSFDGKADKNSGKYPTEVTEANVVRENTQNDPGECIPAMVAFPVKEDPIVWVKDAVRLGKALADRQIKMPEWYRNHLEKDDAFFLNGFERSDVRIVDRQDGDDRYFFPEDHNGFFTELEVLKNCYFTRAIDTSQNRFRAPENKTVDNIFLKKRNWQRIAIVPDWGPNCTILLGDGDEQITINARLCQGSEHVIPGKTFDATAILREYKIRREARLSKLAGELAGWRHFFRMARMFQSEQEWCMDYSTWIDYFDNNLPMMQKRYGELVHAGLATNDAAAQKALDDWRSKLKALNLKKLARTNLNNNKESLLTATLRVTGFGVYNCDQIFRLGQNAIMVEAAYETAKGERIIPTAVRMIERDSRLFFSISQKYSIYKLPGKNVDILVTDQYGRTFHLPAQRYAATDFGAKTTMVFVMDDVTQITKSPYDWAELLSI